ncbi:hypothetical protein JST97_37385 [bacterium]|nr:hypothetical protein [bacterium]
MSRNLASRQNRRASRKATRGLHSSGQPETRFSPRRLAQAELRAQDLESDYDDI